MTHLIRAQPFGLETWRCVAQRTEPLAGGLRVQVTLFGHRHESNRGGISAGVYGTSEGDPVLLGGAGYELIEVDPAQQRDLYEATCRALATGRIGPLVPGHPRKGLVELERMLRNQLGECDSSDSADSDPMHPE